MQETQIDAGLFRLWKTIQYTELGILALSSLWVFPAALIHPAFAIGVIPTAAWAFVLQQIRWNTLAHWIRI